MKILYHHRTRAEDAQGVHIQEMVKAFQRQGHEVFVAGLISPDKSTGRSSYSSFIGRMTVKAPYWLYEVMELVYNLYAFYYLCRRTKKFRPDVIYERYAIFTFAGLIVARLFKIPFILEVNAPLALEKKKYTKLFFARTANIIERYVCSKAFKTIVVSTPLKKIMQENGVLEEKLVVIPNGVNTEVFYPEIDGTPVRDRYGLNGKIVLGFVGWMREWHGLEDLLRLYVDHQMDKKNIHLLLIGDGPALGALQEFAKKSGILNQGVTLTGAVPRDDIPQYIAAFDLALQPDSTDYACPIKLVEYMGMGKGAIAPDKSNIREMLSDDYPGLFQAGNWQSMAEIILKNSSGKEKARALGEQAYQRLKRRKFFWTENVTRVLALLQAEESSPGKHSQIGPKKRYGRDEVTEWMSD